MDTKKAYEAMQKAWDAEVGDNVKVLRKATEREMGWAAIGLVTWMSSLDRQGQLTISSAERFM